MFFNMLRLAFASLFLAVVAAAPADEKKTFPGWPNSFSATFEYKGPFDSPEWPKSEEITKIWYDGDAPNLKEELNGRTMYSLTNYKGHTSALITVELTGQCSIKYGEDGGAAKEITLAPLPSMQLAEFVGEYDVEGEKLELWQLGREEIIVKLYMRQQEGVAIPVRFELYKGGNTVVPLVVLVKDFTTTKPDASVFEFDASKCSEVSKPTLWFL